MAKSGMVNSIILKTMKRIIVIITSVLICFFMTVPSVAQNKNNILNRIVNKYNQPVKDALIETEDGKYISKTASDGTFRLPAEYLSEAISISADGYLNSRVTIADLPEEGDVVLAFDPHGMGGKVNYGYLAQTKESVTGAVATVSGAILDKTPSNVLSDTYEGRLPGLTVINNIAELTFFGYGNFSKSIRGYSSINGNTPLVIIDGVIAPTQYIEFISPKEIESIAVLKDASATAAYGIQGSAGVIVITTKRGHDGSLNVEAYADQSFQQQTRKPLFINSAQYATLRNEAAERDGLAPYSQFSQEEIDLFRAGDDPRYPNNNWYDMFIKDVVMRQRVGVNVSGGTEKFRYYSNLSFVHQEEPFKIVDEPNRKYDPTPNVNIETVEHAISVGAINLIPPELTDGVPFGTQRICIVAAKWCLIDVDHFVDSLHHVCLCEDRELFGEICPVTQREFKALVLHYTTIQFRKISERDSLVLWNSVVAID
jgi:TonB-dependent SusC/RagA subfamily outer membrane receptor